MKTRWFLIPIVVLATGQVFWWAYLLINQKIELAQLKETSSAISQAEKFKFMIISEGFFFLFVFGVGIWFAFKTYQERLDLQKSHTDFISAVTHELKTPIASIQLCLETLTREGLDKDQIKKYIERGLVSVSQLNREVETILTIGAIDTTLLENREVLLNEFLSEIVAEHEARSKVKILVKHPNEEPSTKIPVEPIKNILNCLIENSIKYSKTSSFDNEIEVNISHIINDDEWTVKIEDKGPGMTKEEIQKAFQPFWRSERAIEKAIPGTGLGLHLAKKLADRISSEIYLESEGENKGTKAIFTWKRDLT